jgi:hypothetical protein
MPSDVQIVTRPVRQITISTGRPWAAFRAEYEKIVPSFDRMEAIGVVLSGSGWPAIVRLSEATATNGFVNFFTFDPSPVMHLNGNNGHVVTYLAGNIAKAEPGFKAQPACFVYVPLRVAIAADATGQAQLIIDHPSDLFAAFGNPALDVIAADFAVTFAELLGRLDLSVPDELANP